MSRLDSQSSRLDLANESIGEARKEWGQTQELQRTMLAEHCKFHPDSIIPHRAAEGEG